MELHLIEATNGFNWGKFAIGRPDTEWDWTSRADNGSSRPILARLGWGPEHLWVLDLATGEGAFLRHGGHAHNDLEKHRIWVCPLFEPFLEWLWKQDICDLNALPGVVDLAAEPEVYGRRRPGPQPQGGTG